MSGTRRHPLVLWIARITAPWRAPSDAEVEREIADHLALEAEERATDGSSPAGGSGVPFGRAATMESTREVWRWVSLDQLGQDVRHSLRALKRTPAYSLASIITLGCGIGAATIAFSFGDAVFRRPFPLLPQDQLVWLTEHSPRCPTCTELSPAAFALAGVRAASLGSVVATSRWRTPFRGAGDAGSETVEGFQVSPETFTAISAPFALGHTFDPRDGQPDRPDVAIVSYDFWRTKLGASRTVIDSSITLGGAPRRLVGVLAQGVAFPTAADVYTPLVLPLSSANDYGSRYLDVFARLAPGATMDAVRREIAVVSRRLADDSPKTDADWDMTARALVEFHTDDVAMMRTLTDVATLLVFLAACLSVANLTLARAAARRGELAVRAALGGRRVRLARHLIVEALIVGLAGGLLGALLAAEGIGGLRAAMPVSLSRFVPGWSAFHLDARVLAFAMCVSIGAVAVFATLPILRATRVNLAEAFSENGRTAGGSVYGTRARAVFVVVEVSVSLVLLTGATLLGRSVRNMVGGDPGVRRDNALTMHLTLENGLSDSAMRDVYRRLDVALDAESGIRGAGVASTTPLSNSWWGAPFEIPGRAPGLNEHGLSANDQRVTPRYLPASGVRILDGRGIASTDSAGGQRVVVVSKLLSTAMWPTGAAVGRTMRIGGAVWTVVGVAGDVHHGGFDEPVRYTIYRAIDQASSLRSDLFVWTSGDPDAMRATVRRVVATVDPNAGIGDLQTMRELEARHVSPFRMIARLLGVLAIVTTIIAVVGLYGVIAYGVAQRRREISVRIAVGAQRRDIIAQIAGSAVRLTGIGVLIGGAGALVFARLLEAMLYGVGAGDPRTPLAAGLVLLTAAALAAFIPAWRASSIDPTTALRSD